MSSVGGVGGDYYNKMITVIVLEHELQLCFVN